jgi:hypothetical protein
MHKSADGKICPKGRRGFFFRFGAHLAFRAFWLEQPFLTKKKWLEIFKISFFQA